MLQLICVTLPFQADSFDSNTNVITGFFIYAFPKDSIMVRQQVMLYYNFFLNGQALQILQKKSFRANFGEFTSVLSFVLFKN